MGSSSCRYVCLESGIPCTGTGVHQQETIKNEDGTI